EPASPRNLHSFPTRRSSDLQKHASLACDACHRRADNSPRPSLPGHKACIDCHTPEFITSDSPLCLNCHTDLGSQHPPLKDFPSRSEEHTSELQSQSNLVCRL